MFTPDVRFEGFTSDDWLRLGQVLRPERPRASDASDAARPSGVVVAVTRGARLSKLLHSERGRLPVLTEPWPATAESLAARHGARWAALLGEGALGEWLDRFADRLQRGQDLTAQARELIAALCELEEDGVITLWPRRAATWPVPSERLTSRALDTLCADGKSMMLGVFDAGRLHTCLLARRRGVAFDLVLGPDELRSEMGLLSGDWRRDHRHLARAAEHRAGELALACYAEADTLRRLMSQPVPGAWSAAVAARDVILSPVAPGVALPLGLDLGWVALRTVRGLAERLGAGAWLGADGPLAPALERARELYVERDVPSLLGFDPLALLRQLLARDTER